MGKGEVSFKYKGFICGGIILPTSIFLILVSLLTVGTLMVYKRKSVERQAVQKAMSLKPIMPPRCPDLSAERTEQGVEIYLYNPTEVNTVISEDDVIVVKFASAASVVRATELVDKETKHLEPAGESSKVQIEAPEDYSGEVKVIRQFKEANTSHRVVRELPEISEDSTE